jgi:flagellar hook-associated protein 1 FlgK
MSIFNLFAIGKSAIFASQTALNVVSNNIANVNTPGFSRQEVILKVSQPVNMKGHYIGGGLGDVEIKRHYDKFLHLQIIGQKQHYGRSSSLEQGLSQVEQIFNEAKGLGLSDPLKEYFNAWQDVANNPEGHPQRITLLQKANTLVNKAKQMESDLLNKLKYINEEIVDVVNNVNSITSNIAALNEKITIAEAGLSSEEASYFRDERDLLLGNLSELTEFTWYEDSNGAVTIHIDGKILVENVRSVDLTTADNLEGDKNVYLNGVNINSFFQEGKLGGFISIRDDIKSNPLHGLRKLIASITKETNLLHRTGYGLDSSTNNNFFDQLQIYTRNTSSGATATASVTNPSNPSAVTLDEYDINFINATDYEVYNRQTGALVASGTGYVPGNTINFDGIDVVINGTIASGDSFFISPLTGVIENFNVGISDKDKIAAASSNTDLPGDNSKALQIVQLSQNNISDLDSTTFEGYYTGIVSNIGVMSKAASDSYTYDENLLFELEKKREAVSGVSMDEEAVNLIRYQRSFEAGARILKVTDELLEMVINL